PGRYNGPLFQVAKELEAVALQDEYFTSRKLFPNVDFYSGITLSAMGFPTTMFTVLFALARTVGWIAQWQEMMADPSQKIGRPRQPYTGPTERDYVPLAQRGYAIKSVRLHKRRGASSGASSRLCERSRPRRFRRAKSLTLPVLHEDPPCKAISTTSNGPRSTTMTTAAFSTPAATCNWC